MQSAVPAGQGTHGRDPGNGRRRDRSALRARHGIARNEAGQRCELGAHVEAIVEPANFNAPGQIVIAGSADAIAEAVALIKAGGEFAGGKAIPLQVSAPFHCRLMGPRETGWPSSLPWLRRDEKPKALILSLRSESHRPPHP